LFSLSVSGTLILNTVYCFIRLNILNTVTLQHQKGRKNELEENVDEASETEAGNDWPRGSNNPHSFRHHRRGVQLHGRKPRVVRDGTGKNGDSRRPETGKHPTICRRNHIRKDEPEWHSRDRFGN